MGGDEEGLTCSPTTASLSHETHTLIGLTTAKGNTTRRKAGQAANLTTRAMGKPRTRPAP